MHIAFRAPAVSTTTRSASELEADLLVVPYFEQDDLKDHAQLDRASGGEIGYAQLRGELTGKIGDVWQGSLAGSGWASPRVVLVGAGPRGRITADVLRRAATAGGAVARGRRVVHLAILDRQGLALDPREAVQAITEGAVLANFDGASYKTSDPSPSWVESVVVQVSSPGSFEDALERGRVLGICTNEARALANEPGNTLTPRVFADRAAAIGREAGLAVEVLDEARIADLQMGLLLGVARGSQEPPRMVVLRHEPAQPIDGIVLGLIGKGITFDTGGISIKPAENMDKMKDDMSGGAAVIGAMAAISRLRVPVRCIGVVPMSENMPGGRAIKPGDVLTSAEGKTVEILNTDAEGRLVLGDALWYARQLGATHLVDVATLTGACVVALGKTTSGLFGTPDAWVEQVRQAGERAGDRCWPMPVFDDYREQLKSEIADFTNTGGRAGGAITGALFIKEFAGGLPWVHMDIAGTAWADEAKPWQPKGPTGVAVRTLAQLALGARTWGTLTA